MEENWWRLINVADEHIRRGGCLNTIERQNEIEEGRWLSLSILKAYEKLMRSEGRLEDAVRMSEEIADLQSRCGRLKGMAS